MGDNWRIFDFRRFSVSARELRTRVRAKLIGENHDEEDVGVGPFGGVAHHTSCVAARWRGPMIHNVWALDERVCIARGRVHAHLAARGRSRTLGGGLLRLHSRREFRAAATLSWTFGTMRL